MKSKSLDELCEDAESIDSVDLNELRSFLGTPIFVAFFDAVQGCLTVDDDPYTVAVKKCFVQHQFITLIESLRRK